MHERVSVNALCFPGAPFSELTAHWRDLGARRVSFISNVFDEGLPAVQTALRAGGHKAETVVDIFLPFGQHLEPREESWRAPRERLNRLIDSAKAIGAQSIYFVSGGHGTLTWEEAAECFSAAVAPCVAHAKSVGIPLMIENTPQLYYDTHITHSLRDTVTLAEMAGVGVCIDLFGCWGEAGLQDTIKRAIPRCHVVQVSDYVYGDRSFPCRAVPGDGAIPLKRLCDWILSAGYQGAFDIEMIGPRIDKEGRVPAVRRAADKIGEILHALGA
ncbi:MAG: sugar phosphate isomerase/epimerase [Rhodospirillaceae bacterium]|nr:MAG: sugar phosphate isomerase/epimerase [Rhodospirillaceae bacterium]